ncbi:MAG: flagellar export chaperone FliS [Chloroflexota bacterium]
MAVYPSTQPISPSLGVATYRRNQVTYASPQELLLKLYDIAIGACRRRDGDQARGAVVELVDSLNFEYAEVAAGLLRLYNYCLELIGGGQFDDAERILAELRATWAKALISG